jgi:hypothetical protein
MRFNTCAILVLAAAIIGCAGPGGKDPMVPLGPAIERSSTETNRHLWGIWDVHISADHAAAEVVPLRTADMHLNAVRLLEVTPCTNCITISNVHPSGANECEADIQLRHPFPGLLKYTGFDVRGIFISLADLTFPSSGRKIAWGDNVPRMVDPDGYTSLFNPTEFPPTTPAAFGYIPGKNATGGDLSATLNPFMAYRKDAPRRMFEAGSAETKTARIHAPAGPIHFGYAVDVSWQLVESVIDPLKDFPPDANCLEAYMVDVQIGPGLTTECGARAPIRVRVFDHQGNDSISAVTIEAPDLFPGELSLSFSIVEPDQASLFTGILTDDNDAPVGDYPLLVRVVDKAEDQNLGVVDAWQVETARVTPPYGWARTWGGKYFDIAFGVCVDECGNAYITGYFTGTVDFDPGPGEDYHASYNNNWADAFLSKFDPAGDLVWARTWGATGYDACRRVAADDSGNVYVAGLFNGSVDFDPGPGEDIHSGSYDFFLSKFDPDGTFLWARTWGSDYSQGVDSVNGLDLDEDGSACLTGCFWKTVDFDAGPGVDEHTANGFRDSFLTKLDTNGNFLWACTWGANKGYNDEEDEGQAVAVDHLGNVYVSGLFVGTVDFDPGPGVENRTGGDIESTSLSKFDSGGNFIWVRTWGEAGYSGWCRGRDLDVNELGDLFLTGEFDGTVDFDPGDGVEYHSCPQLAVFLSKLDTGGDFHWARTWGAEETTGYDSAVGVATDPSGNAYVTGDFNGSVDFDPGSGTDVHFSNGGNDAYLSRFDPTGEFLWALTWGGSGGSFCDEAGMDVAVYDSQSVYVTGYFQSTQVDFDPSGGEDKHTSYGEKDAFLSKFLPDGLW